MGIQRPATKTGQTKPGLLPPLLAWPWLWLAFVLLALGSILAWQQEPRLVPANRTAQQMSFFAPNESNPHRRLFTSYEDFRSISFAEDGLHGWVAGGKDIILATVDGGKHWHVQKIAVPQDNITSGLANIHAHADGKRAWVTGDKGFIASTIDGGEHWITQNSNTSNALHNVSVMADGQHAWTVGEGQGTLLASTDGGKNWAPQPNNLQRRLQAISFHPDGQHGWILSGGASVCRTGDGGQTWDEVSISSNLRLYALATSENPRHVWVAGENGSLFFSKDDGKTWEKQNSTLTSEIAAITFQANGLHGWASTYNGEIIATSDGGQTWTQQINEIPTALTSIHFMRDGLNGWVAGRQGVIIHTDNGGQTWHALSATSQPDLNAVTFDHAGIHGWAVGSNGLILATSDAGIDWYPQHSGVSNKLLAVAFSDNAQNGWAVGDNGIILATRNGGQKWLRQVNGNNATLVAVGFDQAGINGWAATANGGLIASTNGGESWDAKTDWSVTSVKASAIQFTKDGSQAWTIDEDIRGLGGSLMSTSNHGIDWNPVSNSQGLDFIYTHFNEDRQHVWAITGFGVTANGKTDFPITLGEIVASEDGGHSWKKQQINAPAELLAIHINNDQLHGWAVGKSGLILATTDGGKNWNYAEHYSRSPALWYWLLVAASAFCLWLSWHFRPKGNAPDSVADVAASDAEIRQPADDKLEFSGLARGISRFLRNTETQPPLTMAITGDWGSGKSSLMQLVCADLRKFGHRPIWFNAWHHQKAENLFAGLLGAIYAQAAPELLSFSGILFRLNLLWCRSRRHFGAMMLAIIIVTSLSILSWNAWHLGGMQNMLTTLDAYLKNMSQPSVPVATPLTAFLAAVTALCTALYTLAKGTSIFGVNPATLLASVGDSMSLKTATAQNDFRDQFARQFRELTLALPYRLVIVIDDLDRCRPEAILEVMEAVNYLTSSGDCFVIFGMAKERVQAALGLAFKDIAAEMLAMDESSHTEETSATKDDATLIKRRAYAADYLQKLVNIEIKVPGTRDKAVHRLLVSNEAAPARRSKEFFRLLTHTWPLFAAALAVLLGLYVAESSFLKNFSAEPPPAIVKTENAAPVKMTVAVSASSPAANAPSAKAKPEINYDKPMYPGEGESPLGILAWLGLALVPVLFVAVIVFTRLLRKNILETRDSEHFRDALEIWTSVIASKRSTPRAIKRFGNRLRYLAMLQQGEARDETLFDVFRDNLFALLRSEESPSKLVPATENALSEYQLIAIGAIYEVYGEKWKDKLSGEHDLKMGYAGAPATEKSLAEKNMEDAVKMHQNKFDIYWPPSAEEIQVFERLIAGVRLAGDPKVINHPLSISERHKNGGGSFSSSAVK
ncbi:YCF48-related protein [Undibacterium sp. TJN19]|uniref:YCF48-related protein n=1 Tax=Undibacterium sp. TJN19 TaxID=3413055 RepID=UPI003BF38D23